MKAVSVKIDLKALVHNAKVIKNLVPSSKIIAVVKANAYGHGLVTVARALDDYADAFAVARLEEALTLRFHGVAKPVVLLEGFLNKEDLSVITENGFYMAVHDLEQVQDIEQAVLPKPLKCWMKIDIGMHRLGASPEEVPLIKERLENCPNVCKPLGLISHLSVADTPSEFDYNRQQIEYFFKVAQDFEGDLCLANSAGILLWPKTHTAWVRPGIILYGISPFEKQIGADFGLEPVMTLRSTVIAVRKVKKGAKVGYGAAWQAPYDTKIAIVAVGYGDGYPRCAPSGTPVYIRRKDGQGRLVESAGHVCMDMMFVNLGPDGEEQVGDEAVLWGKEVPVEKVAALCNTIPYELLCHIMPRVDVEILE